MAACGQVRNPHLPAPARLTAKIIWVIIREDGDREIVNLFQGAVNRQRGARRNGAFLHGLNREPGDSRVSMASFFEDAAPLPRFDGRVPGAWQL